MYDNMFCGFCVILKHPTCLVFSYTGKGSIIVHDHPFRGPAYGLAILFTRIRRSKAMCSSF